MLLERSQVIVGAIFGVLLLLGTAFAVVWSDEVFRGGDRVVVELADAQGLEAGATVLVAGLRAGSVESVTVVGDRVEAAIRLEVPMPSDSSAEVILQNLVGKRALSLVAGDDWDHLLADREEPRIPLERTEGLVDIPQLSDETVALLRDADTEALRSVITSLADITEGQREELGQLLDGVHDVSAVLASRREALGQLLERAEVVVDAVADEGDDLTTIIDRFGSTLDVLADRRTDVQRLLAETATATDVTADLLAGEQHRLDRVLDEVHEVLEIADRHQVDIAHSFAYGGVAFQGFAEVGRSGEADNPYWGNILTTGVGEAGIDAFAGCGGVIDRFLDEIFGPAPCPEEQDRAGDGPADGGGQGGDDEGGLLVGRRPAGTVASLFTGAMP